jgi:hypothetical protein
MARMSKTDPTNKKELFEYAKIRLGAPVNRINVHDDQMEVCLTDALELFDRHHFDATEHLFVAQTLTTEDVATKSIKTPEHVVDVYRILSFAGQIGNDSLLWVPGTSSIGQGGWLVDSGVAGGFGNVDQGVGAFGRTNLVEIYLSAMQASEYEAIMVAEPEISFNSLSKRLQIHVTRNELVAGNFLVYECLSSLAKRDDPSIYKSDWLRKYFVALVRSVYGDNFSKFDGNMLGLDVRVNWQRIVEQAEKDKMDLEEELRTKWSAPPMMWIG